MGFSNDTTKHFKVYSPERGYVHRASIVKVGESVKGGSVELRLRYSHTTSQGTKNIQPDRQPRGRPANTTTKEAA